MEKESRTIVFASHNAHKTEEMRRICGERFRIVSLADLGCDTDIPENGLTLEENAEAKVRWVYERYGMECFADDTGLEVDALGGAPGVHTARFAGPECDTRANVDLLKPELEAHIATLDVPGPDNMIRKTNARAKAEAADGSYLGGLSLCPIPASDIEFYPDEAELLNREMEYILGM